MSNSNKTQTLEARATEFASEAMSLCADDMEEEQFYLDDIKRGYIKGAQDERTLLEQTHVERENAIEVHKNMCVNSKCHKHTTFSTGIGNNQCEEPTCLYMTAFIKKLN